MRLFICYLVSVYTIFTQGRTFRTLRSIKNHINCDGRGFKIAKTLAALTIAFVFNMLVPLNGHSNTDLFSRGYSWLRLESVPTTPEKIFIHISLHCRDLCEKELNFNLCYHGPVERVKSTLNSESLVNTLTQLATKSSSVSKSLNYCFN